MPDAHGKEEFADATALGVGTAGTEFHNPTYTNDDVYDELVHNYNTSLTSLAEVNAYTNHALQGATNVIEQLHQKAESTKTIIEAGMLTLYQQMAPTVANAQKVMQLVEKTLAPASSVPASRRPKFSLPDEIKSMMVGFDSFNIKPWGAGTSTSQSPRKITSHDSEGPAKSARRDGKLKCKGQNADGTACGNPAPSKGGDYCHRHADQAPML